MLWHKHQNAGGSMPPTPAVPEKKSSNNLPLLCRNLYIESKCRLSNRILHIPCRLNPFQFVTVCSIPNSSKQSTTQKTDFTEGFSFSLSFRFNFPCIRGNFIKESILCSKNQKNPPIKAIFYLSFVLNRSYCIQ